MDYLTNTKNGRVFVSTPELLRAKHMRSATPEEIAAHLKNGAAPRTKEAQPQVEQTEIDPYIDISGFDKAQMQVLAAKLPGVKFAQSTKVGEMKRVVQAKLDEMKEAAPATGVTVNEVFGH